MHVETAEVDCCALKSLRDCCLLPAREHEIINVSDADDPLSVHLAIEIAQHDVAREGGQWATLSYPDIICRKHPKVVRVHLRGVRKLHAQRALKQRHEGLV